MSVLLLIPFLAFFAEFIDSSLGMGYGTSLTPLLILLNFDPLQIVPALLLSEFITGILGALTHHKAGNVDIKPKSFHPIKILKHINEKGLRESARKGLPRALIIAMVLSSLGLVGAVASVVLAVKLPKEVMNVVIGSIIMLIGGFIILTRNAKPEFKWSRVIILGLIASFNKGMSGGGYGPLVTGGQLVAGIEPKNAIAITSFSEAFTSGVGFVAYLFLADKIDLSLVPYLLVGAVLSTPFSAHAVKKSSHKNLKLVVGGVSMVLGLLLLFQYSA